MAKNSRSDSVSTIAKRLRLVRIAHGIVQGQDRGMSQAQFTRLAGIGSSAWNNFETGDNRIGLDNAIKVCKATGASLDYIYLGNTSGLPHALALEISRAEKYLRSK
jgi:transcriptional regulator with XRE-family HTH domain